MGIQFSERSPDVGGGISFDIKNILFSDRSEYQKITILESEYFGRVLLIDDLLMLTEKDEFVYHEMISHVPLFCHPNPRRVLVIGGGDGGTVRECLRHDCVEQIDLVEIDEMVTQTCLRFLPGIAGKLHSERVTCRFEDGVAFVKNSNDKYDVVIVDSTDPISVGEGLFTSDFYRDCFNILQADGLLVNQGESPFWQQDLVTRMVGKLKGIFPQVHYYQAHIPTYPSGHWGFGFASKRYHPLTDFQQERFKASRMTFQYYNAALHQGCFALPTFIRKMIDDAD